ncbi:hypothetical protein ACQ86N_09390 [Puia sp. P3]|uniref:hypothetical protein n=1 Tax=Puia sp. P3 TaxID=3423952 RepID=UPI003D66BC7A
MNILEKIIAFKKREVEERRARVTVKELEGMDGFSREVLSLKKFLTDPSKTGIIAEFKRRSLQRA